MATAENVSGSCGSRARNLFAGKLPFRMIPAPMAGEDSIPAVGVLDATGSKGRVADLHGHDPDLQFSPGSTGVP